ncbi:CLUMA_CG011985, isoform A [Clunio marinus]|uniref:CLUMA_CG011985, isoform A n=1 Tax=Clunio marinus TaxID=568069 RepID=A0A1J1IIY9_9DIPT|nr:CLUMA_CG011985, isoform A [Clunio marinus]
MIFLFIIIHAFFDFVMTTNSYDNIGPTFDIEPPTRLDFTNNIGGRLDCVSRGIPTPNIEWFDNENNPVSSVQNIRHILANGSLYFPPFSGESFRQDVHWTTYKCVAVNSIGTIVSRDVFVKAVIHQRYDLEVQNPGGFIGSNVIIKCNIPQFVKEYVKVTSWLEEPMHNIYPSLEGDSKFHMLPTGELIVINVTQHDAQKTFRCRTLHSLTQDVVISSSVGRIQLTEMKEPVPPIMNDKIKYITIRMEESVVIPCVAYANPKPLFRWFFVKQGRNESIDHMIMTGRYKMKESRLIIQSIEMSDNTIFYCTATNDQGSETLEIQLKVVAPLQVHIQPIRQTVDVGKTADLKCMISGTPQSQIWWLKDGQPLRTGSRVRLLNKDNIRITSVSKDDQGMFQCFVKNDVDIAQGIAEVSLGEIAPQLHYRFIEQTLQPGPGVSLKCTATGSPTPQISWTLDGFPLPNNDRLMIGQYVTISGDVISHVNISAVKTEDGGEYACTARSRAGQNSHSARLNIYGMPFVRSMSPISAVAGRVLQIKCPVAGFPIDKIVWEKIPPKVSHFEFSKELNVGDRTSVQCVVGTGDLPLVFTWLKDNVPIKQSGTVGANDNNNGNSRYNNDKSNSNRLSNKDTADDNTLIMIRQNDEFTSALSILSIKQSHAGEYTCRVANDAATVQYAASLKVNVPPRITPFNFGDDIQEGMRVQTMCTSTQGDQPFNITWYRDSKALKSGTQTDLTSFGSSYQRHHFDERTIEINIIQSFSSILTIHNITSQHNGNYTCQISNPAGVVDYTVVLSVSVPPRWIIEPKDESAILGTSLVLTCKADGFPTPTVQWKQSLGEQSGDYRELIYNDGSSSIQTFNNGTLLIQNVTREHEGNFLCQANNGIGAGLSKLIRLTVHVGPHVIIRNKQVSVRRGERTTLRCEADGDKPLDIAWRFKNGQIIGKLYDTRYEVKNNDLSKGALSELTILQSALSDRGEYTCVATNAFGHDHSLIHLQVQEPPSAPQNLHVNELHSRSVTLSWAGQEKYDTVGYVDPQPVTRYILQFKESQDVWHDYNQKAISGEKNSGHVGNLKPATNYHFRLFAENTLGTSISSDILHIQTDGETPSGSPQKVNLEPIGPTQLLVTWRPPDREHWNGEILGYAIGFHKSDEQDHIYNYTRIGASSGEGSHEFRLVGLEKYTGYNVIVLAFNGKGDGPPSKPMLAHTLEDVPSASPQKVTCSALTSQNVQISWQPPPVKNMHGVIQGYKVLYETSNIVTEYLNRETKVTTALSTVLHGLQPFTNYSVQVQAFTRAGEGVASQTLTCRTEESTPDAPEKIKAIVTGENSVIISWLPPRRPNGILSLFTIFIRVLDKGQEMKIIKTTLPAHNNHYEAKNLNQKENYEAWVTASTKLGSGPSTPVVKLVPNSQVPAQIVSFGQIVSVSWKVDVKLPCLYVGHPKPTSEWTVANERAKQSRMEIGEDNTLTMRNVQRIHESNYTCYTRNAIGNDRITYQLYVQVPPGPPKLTVTSNSPSSATLHWHISDTGGAPIKNYLLTYRRHFGEWHELILERRSNSHILDNLQCGTEYEFTIAALNKIGSGATSETVIIKTIGEKPIAPSIDNFLKVNITSVVLELIQWQDGGCPILYFTVEYKHYGYSNEWIIVSSNIVSQARFPIGDLEPSTAYNIRIHAYNNAGSTIAEYTFETLNMAGVVMNSNKRGRDMSYDSNDFFFSDSHILTVSIISIFAVILAVLGVCFFFKLYGRDIFENDQTRQQQLQSSYQHGKNSKLSISEHREQYYQTVRKQSTQSPGLDSALERIPEYSEDIYPYATFHLKDQDKSSTRQAQGLIYESRETMLMAKKHRTSSSGINTGTGSRSRKKSRKFNTESEEYDSLNSDSDTVSRDLDANSRTESSNCLDDTGPVNFSSRAYSPGPRKERLALLQRPPAHHSNPQLLRHHLLIDFYFKTLSFLLSCFVTEADAQCSKLDSNASLVEKQQISEMRSFNDNHKLQISGRHSVDLADTPSKLLVKSRSKLHYGEFINGGFNEKSNRPLNNITSNSKFYGDFLTLTPRRNKLNEYLQYHQQQSHEPYDHIGSRKLNFYQNNHSRLNGNIAGDLSEHSYLNSLDTLKLDEDRNILHSKLFYQNDNSGNEYVIANKKQHVVTSTNSNPNNIVSPPNQFSNDSNINRFIKL